MKTVKTTKKRTRKAATRKAVSRKSGSLTIEAPETEDTVQEAAEPEYHFSVTPVQAGQKGWARQTTPFKEGKVNLRGVGGSNLGIWMDAAALHALLSDPGNVDAILAACEIALEVE